MPPERGDAGGFGCFDFEEFSEVDVVKEAVEKDGFGDEK